MVESDVRIFLKASKGNKAMPENFPQMLKALRREKAWSQKQLAEAAGVHPSYISKLEKGEEKPGRGLIETLARVLEADSMSLVLAAGHIPREFISAISESEELKRLLGLASRGRLSSEFYSKLSDLLDKEDKVNMPVWLD